MPSIIYSMQKVSVRSAPCASLNYQPQWLKSVPCIVLLSDCDYGPATMQKLLIFISLALSHGLKYNTSVDYGDLPECDGSEAEKLDACTEVADNECEGTFVSVGAQNVQCKILENGHCASVGPICKPVEGPGIGLDGVVSWFRSEDADVEWKSKVGDWVAKTTHGSVQKKKEAGHGAKKSVRYVYGNTAAHLNFGKVVGKHFTVCSVSRYAGGHKNRVLQLHHINWLHGHWANRVGVAHYNTWATPYNGPSNEDWLVYCGTAKRRVMKGDAINIANHNGQDLSKPYDLCVNTPGERSEFGIMEVITWDRQLSEDEMKKVIGYLNRKLGVSG